MQRTALFPAWFWRRRSPGKHFLRDGQAVNGGRKAGIDSHLHDDLNDLLTRPTQVQGAMNMDLQLRLCGSHCGKCCDGGDLARLGIQSRPRIDVAEGKL